MSESYEEIVRCWYVKLRGSFTDLLMQKYSKSDMRLADAENIYQDIFLAIHKNLEEGRIRDNWDWRNYIIRIGLNMAAKQYRSSGKTISLQEGENEDPEASDKVMERARKASQLLDQMGVPDDENLYDDPEAYGVLGDQLTLTPEPCASIIRMSYLYDFSDAEIAEDLAVYRDNGKSPDVNAKAIKARRWLCMKDLIYRVKLGLFNAGIINEKPEKIKRNGK